MWNGIAADRRESIQEKVFRFQTKTVLIKKKNGAAL